MAKLIKKIWELLYDLYQWIERPILRRKIRAIIKEIKKEKEKALGNSV